MQGEKKMASELERKEKKLQKRKDLVKNLLIIFLVVMLVLTFFSGTIQNWSLPEVATVYVQSGSISPQIRGTGTIKADDPYNVTATETRKVVSVKVKVGDEVKKGDVIYILDEADSTELETAKQELQDLLDAYNLALFDGTLTDDLISRTRTGAFGNVDEYQARLRDVNDRYNAAVAADAAVQAQIDYFNATAPAADVSAQAAAIAAATEQLSRIDNDIANRTAAGAAMESAMTTLSAMMQSLDEAKTSSDSVKYPSVNDDPAVQTAQNALKTYLEANGVGVGTPADADDAARSYLVQLQMDKAKTDADIAALNASKQGQNDIVNQSNTAIEQLTGYTEAQKAAKLAELQAQKKQTEAQMTAIKAEQEQTLAGIKGELTMQSQLRKLNAAREKIEKMENKTIGNQVEAPVDGTITELACAAGESFEKDGTIAVIQVAGKAMTLSFSVTTKQAATLKVGDKADPQNSWYYTDFKCTLTSIKPDTTDPANMKLLTFTVDSPEVTAGESVSIKIGQATKNYDMTVPNSAIREDNNGKFILIIETKSSPLRNRYIARRVDVDVVASDDTVSAITAPLEGYEYVITTSNAAIKAGQEVRLAEGNY